MAPDHNPRALDCSCASCRVAAPRVTKRADGSYTAGPPPDGRSVDAHLDELASRPRGYNAENRTDYVQSDGSTQVMETVLAERRELTKLKGRKRMDAAYRLRAGMIGVLASCLCDYPLERYATESGHHEKCPSEGLVMSKRR